jgi:hypothetical protein
MSKHAKTLALLDVAIEVLRAVNPMTVRQVYYQLVSRQVIENNEGRYKAVSNLLADARRDGSIPWEWIEDRNRRPRAVPMWGSLAKFGKAILPAYRRDVWGTQPGLVEAWLEKDALSGIFEDVLRDYGVTLQVARGYDGWDSIHNAAERYGNGAGVTVLYFGDFDPSGLDMVRSLRDRLAELGAEPEIIRCALTADDIERYHLPADFTKKTDTRRKKFVAEHGEKCVELDALPVDVLRARLVDQVEQRLDLAALAVVKVQEDRDRDRLASFLTGWA